MSEKFLAPLRPHFTGPFLNIFHRQEFAPENKKFTATFCRGGHAKKLGVLGLRIAAESCHGAALALRIRLFPAVSAALPLALPPPTQVSRQSPRQSPQQSESQLGGLVHGRENDNFWPKETEIYQSALKEQGAAKASCRETVVQKGVFGESVSSLPPQGLSLKTPERF